MGHQFHLKSNTGTYYYDDEYHLLVLKSNAYTSVFLSVTCQNNKIQSFEMRQHMVSEMNDESFQALFSAS